VNPPADRRVAVIGGGITGAAATLAAVQHPSRPEVVLFEAQHRLGGKIRTTPFAGHVGIDEGADAFLRRVPWALQMAEHVGLADTLVAPTSAHAAVWWDGLHRIPPGLLLGLPTDLAALARSRLIDPLAKLRAAADIVLPRARHDDSLGSFVRRRFGSQVHERLVDPLVGSIYAVDTNRFSLAAVPQIAEVAALSRSVLIGARRARATGASRAPVPAPIFATPQLGMESLVHAIVAIAQRDGVSVRLGTPVRELATDRGGWQVNGEWFSDVVLAAPSDVAAALLQPTAGVVRTTATDQQCAAEALAAIDAADVALVTLAIPASQWRTTWRGFSGFLVPKPKQRLVTAVSFGSQKWAHWAHDGHQIVRVSLGRDGLPALHLDDQHLIDAATDGINELLGSDLSPIAQRLSRWPRAFPLYRPHHHDRVAAAEAALPASVVLCGASYHGIGIPACIRSAQSAVAQLLDNTARLLDNTARPLDNTP
jgi:protoporphyrinogen/coproporphyrinogen III oxidase